jgi:hypothetical protein
VNGGRDVAIDEPQAVTAIGGSGLTGEAEVVERPVEPVSGPVAGKDTACSISAMRGGRQSDYKKPGVELAEAGYGPSPIFVGLKAFNLIACNFFPVCHQPWAAPAINDFILSPQLDHLWMTTVVHLDPPKAKMKTDLSMAEILALVEIVDEHVDRNFPGVDPPRLLREVQQKLDTIIVRHRKEIASTIKVAKKKKSGSDR